MRVINPPMRVFDISNVNIRFNKKTGRIEEVIGNQSCDSFISSRPQKTKKQLLKEKELFEKIYLNSSLDRTIVVFDRTCIDAGTFLSPDEYARLLNELNLTKDDIAMYLHGSFVIHMQSMAVTQPEYYDKRNQLSSVLRRESAAEAAASDEKIFLAYEKYKDIFKKHIMIEATDKIEDKSAAVKNAISEFIKFSSKSSY